MLSCWQNSAEVDTVIIVLENLDHGENECNLSAASFDILDVF